jgi:hypothetical protein
VTGLVIVVETDDLPPLPTAVEVAAFRISVDGMMNVVRNARARWYVSSTGGG